MSAGIRSGPARRAVWLSPVLGLSGELESRIEQAHQRPLDGFGQALG
jgi:hypothetical protein